MTLYAAYPGLGKTFFLKNSGIIGVEVPFKPMVDLARELKHHLGSLRNLNVLENELTKLYDFYFKNISEDYDILLGVAFPIFYKIMKYNLKIPFITLLPENTWEAQNDYYNRYYYRNPGGHEIANSQMLSWPSNHEFFEREAERDSNIIFTKAGEYLTDYLDTKTGKFKRPELLEN